MSLMLYICVHCIGRSGWVKHQPLKHSNNDKLQIYMQKFEIAKQVCFKCDAFVYIVLDGLDE